MDLSKMTPTEIIAEAERRTVRRKQGLILEGNPAPASHIKAAFVAYQDPSDWWVQATPHMRRLSLPWSLLVSDNERSQPIVLGNGKLRFVASAKYKAAKQAARELLTQQVGGNPPLAGRVRVTATLIEPNASRTRDLSNFAKLVNDVMSGIVYVDDGQIDSLTWQRGVPDIDRPRLLLAVEEIYL